LKKIRGFEKVSTEQWIKDGNGDYAEIKLPKRSTSHSAGYDIFSTIDFTLQPNEDIKIPLGWKVYMKNDEFLMIVPRSGMGFKYYTRLANSIGIIDCDFYNNSGNEGHCWAKIRNEGNMPLSVKKGDAIAQGMFQRYLLADLDDFTGETRTGGFGSTDK